MHFRKTVHGTAIRGLLASSIHFIPLTNVVILVEYTTEVSIMKTYY